MEPPFAISAEAERYIRERLDHEPPQGMEPSLNRASRLEVRDKRGILTQRSEREHYFLGYRPPDRHTEFVHCDIFGRSVAFHPRVLESLTGKCLTIGYTDQIEGVERMGEILIAVPRDEATQET